MIMIDCCILCIKEAKLYHAFIAVFGALEYGVGYHAFEVLFVWFMPAQYSELNVFGSLVERRMSGHQWKKSGSHQKYEEFTGAQGLDLAMVVVVILDVVLVMALAAINPLADVQQGRYQWWLLGLFGLVLTIVWMVDQSLDQLFDWLNYSHVIQHMYAHLDIKCDGTNKATCLKIQPHIDNSKI